MIHEVDASISELIRRDALPRMEIAFDAPTTEWVSRRNGPAVNVFLYDIREDLGRRDVAPQPVYDATGYIVDRRPPPRRFKLSYLLTAWTQRPEDEHRLLSQLLGCLIQYDRIPPECLQGVLADQPLPVLMQLALPPTQDRSLSDVWSALGGELKPAVDLRVTAPLEAGRSYETGPPTMEGPSLWVEADAAKETKSGRPSTRRRKGADTAEADAPAFVANTLPPGLRHLTGAEADAARAEAAARGASAADDLTLGRRAHPDPDHEGGEIVTAGTTARPGRTLRVRPMPRKPEGHR